MTDSVIDEKNPKPSVLSDDESLVIEEQQWGVWRVRIASEPLRLRKLWINFLSAVPVYWRLAVDIFSISPYYLSVFVVCHILCGLEDAILLDQSNKLLRAAESGISSGNPDGRAIVSILVAYVLLSWLFSGITRDKFRRYLYNRVTGRFQLLLIKSNLQLDLPASQEQGSKHEGDADDASDALRHLILFFGTIIRSGSQLAFVAQMSEALGGPLFIFISLSHPIFSTYTSKSLWDTVCYGHINNSNYQRLHSLKNLAEGSVRQDIIAGGLADWIINEFQQAHHNLGDIQTIHPFKQTDSESSTSKSFLADLVLKFLQFTPTMTIFRAQSVGRDVTSLRFIYRSTDTMNIMTTGTTPYPTPAIDDDEKSPSSQGMGFDLRDLVVIVGTNGSGKSTLVRLLARLYDPDAGSVLIDNLPSSSYCADDLRAATALLSQDSNLYPLSLGENIGLGFHTPATDEDMVVQTARDGGAEEIVKKLKDGFQTVLDPVLHMFNVNLWQNKGHKMYKEMNALRQTINISGGERQRVVASRALMRIYSDKIKFIAVDEPTSALDAEAESNLFKTLLKYRNRKTMVFNGSILEVGTHDELMVKRGEYANLYDIQARAFSTT
ncbi:P-loop containing nucleoside triphosphate hydrolase protein [Pholiota conissans]|uniref:P-loop containing nucleoside triphosphate hydrolase protein n=1 Tax=Pholiota conissans TaxID=109636 RepID=A0A9P5Z5R6_9AGAR|nr:P-loop containing nucleoside triphosphate hydrolase protein [Pholiota conissans]